MANRFGLQWAGWTDPSKEKQSSNNNDFVTLGQMTQLSQDPSPDATTSVTTRSNSSETNKICTSSSSSLVTPNARSSNQSAHSSRKEKICTRSSSTKLSRTKYLKSSSKPKKSSSSPNQLPTRQEVTPSQSTMTQQFPTRTEQLKQKQYEEKLAYITTKPHVFDPCDDVADFTFREVSRTVQKYMFKGFLHSQEKRSRVEEESLASRKNDKKRLKKTEQFEDDLRSDGCGNTVHHCSNTKFGRYCVNAVRAYYHGNKEIGFEPLELAARKVFFDHFHYAVHYDSFIQDGTGNTVFEVRWDDLPLCIKKHSYDDLMQWFDWKKSGGLVHPVNSVKIPVWWHNY